MGEPNRDDLERATDQVRSAFEDKDLPSIYFNGFTNVIGSGDIVVVLNRNDRPIAVLNMSYTIAKTLVQKLNELIIGLEGATSNSIMTVDTIKERLEKGGPDA